ncbi:putative sporulation protein YtxC [Paenibacillus apiarius]|uniref:Sporulation protein YtxC n=1 Tax=Paenibacillus apiarius TaxID=46240 RepID=A0ABT4DUH8_9BACL|nr:putative sporulation protein YtxC [Paenibacillus apiarius]MBN3523053.1 putative sporulation protein YtxC [Paenibacillus apiarius]MCY9516669.1 putative sporulation protein YtxC [Paenibacillus apiarius]MCY9519933.1 putative sporulation protein YtxC [Paenibacillus apiarius]MCY9553829.1 putative sporulation protein YtxC [Paenibacillus apiarius]MCY9557563.1 putative sporulation protein YtxC [Paenibacillus apiarius]
MELFTISLPHASQDDIAALTDLLQQELGDLHKQPNGVEFDQLLTEQMALITCRGLMPGFQLAGQGQDVWNKAARALAEYILSMKEKSLIRSFITKETHYDEREQSKIEEYCLQLLNGTDDIGAAEARRRRKGKVMRVLRRYLEEHTDLNLEGFIRFRLVKYMNELREVVDYAIDEYVLERQYQEFIGLLKYFVFIQETKIPLAHLMHRGGHEFTLLNEQMQPLEPKHVVDGMIVEMLDYDMEMEDMIVSTLINVSPQNIIIHTREPDSQVIKTIQQIFESRVHVCIYCSACQPQASEALQTQDSYT